jgi:hypothetical protein
MTANDDSQITGEELSHLSACLRPDLSPDETTPKVSAVLTRTEDGLHRAAVAPALGEPRRKKTVPPTPQCNPPERAKRKRRHRQQRPSLPRPGNGDLQ